MKRAVLIGCGTIHPMHTESIKQLKNAALCAVCDIKAERMQAVCETYGCRGYTDYKEMLAAEKPDVVHICLPHYLHAEVANYALKHGFDVVTEKPMATSLADAESMIRTAKDTGRKLCVIMQNRYNRASRVLKELLINGELGAIKEMRGVVCWHRSAAYYADSDWRGLLTTEGGGVLINQAIHTLDLMLFLKGENPKSLDATIATLAHDIEVEDTAAGVLDFADGCRANFYFTNNAREDFPIEILLTCEKGTAKMTGRELLVTYADGRAPLEVGEESDAPVIKSYWGSSHLKQIADIYNCLESGEELFVTAQQVLETHKVLFAIFKSGREGKRVTL